MTVLINSNLKRFPDQNVRVKVVVRLSPFYTRYVLFYNISGTKETTEFELIILT